MSESRQYYPLVTIIIPVYNGSNFLAEAIDSALQQDYENLEIVVVNDGSNDDGSTEKIALSYNQKIIYLSKPNGGVSSALNYAMQFAKGEYISWLSHDDLYYPNKVSKEIAFLNKILSENPNISPQKVVIHSATESIDCNGRLLKIPNYRGVDEEEQTIKVIIDNIYHYRLSGCSFLIPINAFHELGGFREDIRTVSDVEYWYRLLFNNYHFYCLTKDRLVKNRSHGKQVGKTKIELFQKELNDLYIAIFEQMLAIDEYNTLPIMEKYYLGLVSRGLDNASSYVMTKGIESKKRSVKNKFILSVKKIFWAIKGRGINVARIIYRKILVK